MFEDLLDPMSVMRRYQQQNFAQDPSQGNIKIEPLPADQEQALLPKIGSAALGGLGYVGSVLEKTFGGRAIRGALGGKPRELLSILPGSDLLGITDEADRVSGRDLLRNAGLAGPEDNWQNFLGGMGVELATDPGMYLHGLGGKAFTEAGQVAKKIGALPSTVRGRVTGTLAETLKANPALTPAAETAAGGSAKLAALLDQPLAGLLGAKIPFMPGEATPLLTGSSGAAALDALGSVGAGISNIGKAGIAAHDYLAGIPGGVGFAYKNLTPVGLAGEVAKKVPGAIDWTGRHLGALFNAKNFGAVEKIGQDAAQVRANEVTPFVAPYLEKAMRYGEELDNLGVKDSGTLRRIIEGVEVHPNPRVQLIANNISNDYLDMLKEAKRLGINIKEFQDPLDNALQYSPRQWATIIENKGALPGGGTASVLGARDATLQSSRQRLLSGMREGTDSINELFQDVNNFKQSGLTADQRANNILQYLRDPVDITNEISAANPGISQALLNKEVDKVLKSQKEQAKRLVGFLDNLPDQYGEAAAGKLLDKSGAPIKLTPFGHNPIDEYTNYVKRFGELRARALASQDLIANNFIESATGNALPKGSISVQDAINRAGLTDNITYATGQGPGSAVGASQAILDRVNTRLAAEGKPTIGSLADAYLDPKAASEISRIMKSFEVPDAVNPAVRALDYLTNLFKTNVTTYWPGFNVRNFITGQVQNTGEAGFDVLKNLPGAKKLLEGGTWEGLENIPQIRDALIAAGRPVNAEEATKQLARWSYAYGIGGHSPNIGREVISSAGDAIRMPRELSDVLDQLPGNKPSTIKGVVDILAGKDPNTSYLRPLDVAGVNTSKDVFTPVVAGRAAGDLIEGLNRLPLYAQSLQEGYTPAEAAKRVLGAHFQYTPESLSSFEKTIMRRLIPFYSYTRQNIPRVIDKIITNPGGVEGTLARISEDTRGKGFIPAYMGEGLAIPIGEEGPDGRQRYLSRLDLPADQAFEWFKGTGGDPVQASIMGLLSQMNPLIKGPVEYATNKQFFSGRELGDLYSMTGNQLLDQLLFNSPLARAATTVRQLSDPAKWDAYALPLNLLTGAKVTDVDMNKYKTIAEREYVKKMLQGNPAVGKFETIAVRPEEVANLSPQEYQLVQLQRLLEKRARDESKARKVRID